MINSTNGGGQYGGGQYGGGDIFALAERKMEWLDQRQRVLAQNIANADTPDYTAKDVSPFEKLLGMQPVTVAQTNPQHMQGRVQTAGLTKIVPQARALDGNAVSIETELTKVADGETAQAMVGNLWKTYMGMYMTALGKSG